MLNKLTIFAFLVLSVNVYAQDSLSSKIKEPDFPFEPMYVDSSYSLMELPVEKYDMDYNRGIGKVETFYKVGGEKSSLRLKKDSSLVFIVKQGLVNGSTTNVKDMYKVFKLTVKKQARSYSAGMYKSNGLHNNSDDLPIKFKKVKEDLYMLIVNNLSKGEYVIEAKVREIKLYSFGID